jgi:hypothetical protein
MEEVYMKNKNTESIHFLVDKALKNQLENKANKQRLTVSAYLRLLILNDLKETDGNKNNG